MTNATINQTEVTTTQVVTVPPVKLDDNQHVISWSRRSTDKTPVKAEERYRAIVVPSASIRLPDGATTSKFSELLQSTIHELANNKFAAWAKDNLMVTQVDASLFSLDAVILYWAEEKKAAQVDASKITDFLKASKTYEALSDEAKKVWLSKIPKIAAPGYANFFSKAQAATIVSKFHADDLESPVAAFILNRCNNIITRETQEEAL